MRGVERAPISNFRTKAKAQAPVGLPRAECFLQRLFWRMT